MNDANFVLEMTSDELLALKNALLAFEHTMVKAGQELDEVDNSLYIKMSNLLDQYYQQNGIED